LLKCHAEGSLDEALLADNVASSIASGFPLRMMFMASYPAIVFSAVYPAEALTRDDALLHEPMVLFDDVVHVR